MEKGPWLAAGWGRGGNATEGIKDHVKLLRAAESRRGLGDAIVEVMRLPKREEAWYLSRVEEKLDQTTRILELVEIAYFHGELPPA
jgi:hypothetical protein